MPLNLSGFSEKATKNYSISRLQKFDNAKFHDDVNNFAFDQFDISNFKETIFNIFDKHIPIKQKYLQENEVSFMKKELHREIMKRLRLRDNFLSTKSQEDRFKYNTRFL